MLNRGIPDEAQNLFNRALLLDPDYKAPYVLLGVAYLRQDCYKQVVEISEAGLARHPDSPQCHYHIGVACCQLLLLALAESRECGNCDTEEVLQEREELRTK